MKHTRVPRTVRRDIWRLAMETLSIPSLHIFWSRIRNQIKSRIENLEKTNGPNRKSNRLINKKNPHTLCHIGLLLGLIDVVQCLRLLRIWASYKQSVTRKLNEPILLFQTERVSFAQTLYQHKSALPYLGCCTLSTRETLIHNPKKMRRYREKRSRRSPWWREVVQRWSSAGQLNFNYNTLEAVSTNIGLCDINNCGTRDSTNFRTTETKTFYEKLKRLGGGYRPLRISTLVKTAH